MTPLDHLYETLIQTAAAEAERRVLERIQLQSIVPDRTLSLKEAAEYVHISESALRQLCKEKRIPHRINGSDGSKNPRYLFSSLRLDRWMREEEEKNYQQR
ncbi:helix-turn-helix domain-containing protein [Desulforamulus ruminis]|uniref:Helix-turn-helix domain-containing protein n=1 Tax=Desulforamulus ruminis (strain ATCC 23193 / DSM 2154 / NCIMB 8452 / DL) TaxID=696281 RepID=F6DM03_DESRL|nr:helix-turn-helix domain-containing protein [Desulforamulus ruminis]AEG59345.1 hypothetical protein Desru_1070 [Desulforamulus ruminis DSM 2154]